LHAILENLHLHSCAHFLELLSRWRSLSRRFLRLLNTAVVVAGMQAAAELRPALVAAHRQVTAAELRLDLALMLLARELPLRLHVLSAAIIPGKRPRRRAVATPAPRNILFRPTKRQQPALA
jgi:hypothetical protein